jgi:transcription antitermination factor NusA-like protein
MKTELCSFCLKSGMLCQKCSTKVKVGEISELDLKIARLLLSLEEKYPSLQNISFFKAFDVGRTVAIVVGHGDVPRLLSYGGKIVKAISEKSGKSIRILEQGVDDRKFLEDLFMPLNILTINTIWLPDGTTETRVILKRKRGMQLPFDLKAIKEIAEKVRKITLRIEFAY